MNAIPLINIAPPRNDNVNKISNKLNNIPVSQNISGAVGMLGNSGFNNETQLRQEVNTSLVALKREAFNLETLINQAAKTLTDVNNRIAALENVQGDYVKKTDVTNTIESGNMNPVTSNAVANSNAMPVNSVTSGNMHSVTSNAVASTLSYSTSEVFTGAYWIDGKPIYRKCFYFETPPADHTVLMNNIDKCIRSGGTQLWGTVYFEFPYVEGSGSTRVRLSPLVNNLHRLFLDLENLDNQVSKCNWWFEYTKISN